MKFLAEVTIPQYVRKIVLAKSRAKTYYIQGENIPKGYQKKIDSLEYEWALHKGRMFLTDCTTGERVVKNKRTAGTERKIIINGQDLHTLRMQDFERSKIIKAIKEQMIPYVEKLEPITTFPIRILCELHTTYMDYEYLTDKGIPKDIDWDVDNHTLMHIKTFPDVLCGCPMKIDKIEDGKIAINPKTGKVIQVVGYQSKRIIPDDHRRYITQHPVPLFFPIDNYEDRKLVFRIYEDDREVIQNSKYYDSSRPRETD